MLVGDTGYALYLLAFPVGMSFSDSNAFLQTLHKHPKTGWKDHNVGHGWIIVESPEQTIECGHTGEDGIERPAYYQGVFEKIRARDPNPIAYLWEEFDDGRFVNGSNGHVPAFVAKLPITAAEHARLIEYINSYDYKHFSLVRKHCTEFVAGAAEIMGVNLVTKVRLKIPREVHFRGKRYTLWTDARYEYLTFGSPDVLDSDLRQLVKEGIAEDAAAWYSK